MAHGQSRYYYLDLNPEFIERAGHRWSRKAVRFLGARNCFAQDDLYTTRWGDIQNVDIERFFFGGLDASGKMAVSAYANYSIRQETHDYFEIFLRYMSVQKLRTPKGIAWLRGVTGNGPQNLTLQVLQRVQNLFCAAWTDSVWQIADASKSKTKFIISDHPVTVYNRE